MRCSRITAHAQEETSRTIRESPGRLAKLAQSRAVSEIPARGHQEILRTLERRQV